MLTEFALLATLTLNADEIEALRIEISDWVKCFLPKMKRESTRTAKCRLIASVERHEFEDSWNARNWQFFKFVGNEGILFDDDKDELEKFKATSFQIKILRKNLSLENVFIGRCEIKEESGNWTFGNKLRKKLISEGGEAVVLKWAFGEHEMAVRIQCFDPFLFSKMYVGQIKWKTHLISDFKTATDGKLFKAAVVPIHENVVRNFANVEIFDACDENEEDCLGWITIMEKCEGNLRKALRNGSPTFQERKNIAKGIRAGLEYLEKVGIRHCDKKLANFLLIGDIAKICDFGIVQENSGRKSYRQLGYARRGSKYQDLRALYSGTPAFAGNFQLGGAGFGNNDYFLFLFCDWESSWYLNFAPIDEQERKEIEKIIKNCGVKYLTILNIVNEDYVIANITKIISLPNASGSFCLDDPNLTASVNMSSWKQQMTKCVNADMKNLTKNILDQKWSNLCVPISVTALIRFAIKNDLRFVDERKSYAGVYQYSFERILTTLTMIVYPRSLAGLNLNPKKEESEIQMNDVETLLKRICQKTFLKESGWEIIRTDKWKYKPAESTCEFKQVLLNENFVFSRPLTVTGAILFKNKSEPVFHQMTLDRIENGKYILQNTQFSDQSTSDSGKKWWKFFGAKINTAVMKIKQSHPYYANSGLVNHYFNHSTGLSAIDDGVLKMKLVNEQFGNMQVNTWYLLPRAYSLTLTKTNP